MAGTGPVPKRDDERIRRNKTGEDGLETQTFTMEDRVVIPKAEFETPEVQAMWEAIQKSVNVKFYEPTDWAYAVMTLRRWDAHLKGGKEPGAMLLSALDGMLKQMTLTEAERRRLKIEAQRGAAVAEAVKASDAYKQLLQFRPSLKTA